MIEKTNLNRALRDESLAIKNGFSLQPPLYILGTPVISLGAENLNKSRKNWEEMNIAQDQCEKNIEIIQNENREDHLVTLKDYQMGEDGYIFNNQTFIPSQWALKQLVQRSRPSTNESEKEANEQAADYVSANNNPIHLRQKIVNYYLSTSKSNAYFRTRDCSLGRELYSVVSNRYNRTVDTIAILKEILEKLDERKTVAKAETKYDGTRFKISLVYHTDIQGSQAVAGEIFKAGVEITTYDNGQGSIKIVPFVIRNLCLNLIILDKATQEVRLSHLMKDLKNELSNKIAQALNSVQDFAEIWTEANKESILSEVYTNPDAQQIIQKLVDNGHARIPGVPKAELYEKLYKAWLLEPSYTRAGFVNCISRAAHQMTWTNNWAQEALEEKAGELLYNRVYINLSDKD